MSRLLTRATVFPLWVLFVGITVMFLPMSASTSVLLLLVGIGLPAILLIVWKENSPTVAEVLHAAEVQNREVTTPPRR